MDKADRPVPDLVGGAGLSRFQREISDLVEEAVGPPPQPFSIKSLNAMNRCRDQTRASGTAAPTRDSLNRNHQSSSCRYLIKLRLEAQSSCLSFLIYGLTNKALFVGYERAPLAAKFRVKMPSPCPIKRCGDRSSFATHLSLTKIILRANE